jgi:hypothetical protein
MESGNSRRLNRKISAERYGVGLESPRAITPDLRELLRFVLMWIRIRAVIIEDDPLAAQYLAALLDDSCQVEVVGSATESEAGLSLCAELRHPTHNDELARANWFWSRRPRLLPAASYTVWLVVVLGLPFWLFVAPLIGVPLLIIAAVIVNVEIARSVRWRRQYELSIDRLIRARSFLRSS